ncbi:hypothetical protein AB0J57_32565 [Streptomyces sp. NPDC049837]|uniref:hypothetical protein n=1 Tax=Streptomyces sp. NPDC049837 TaxID=3155277 RepID=UPI003425EDD8
MRKIHKLLLAALAAVIVVGAVVFVVQDRKEAERAAERESLRLAAESIFQARADKKDALWRQYAAPAGRVWSEARARATLNRVEIQGKRAKVWIQEITTPYTTNSSGTDPQPDIPYVGQYVYVFEPAGEGWTFVKDVTKQEFGI